MAAAGGGSSGAAGGMGMAETDSEDELPPGWEERTTEDGKIFYASHEAKTTQWTHPKTGKRKRLAGELPHGWERKVDPQTGNIFYVDHINKKTSFTDPRLAFAVEDTGDTGLIRQRFDGSSTGLQVALGRDLSGKTAIVTGANAGIGYETVRTLALHGCHVVMACREPARAQVALDALRAERSEVNVEVMTLDLASLDSVREFADAYKLKNYGCNMLILNAAVMSPQGASAVSASGLELTFQVNHLAQWYLTRLLEGVLVASGPGSRVVVVSSESHRFSDLTKDNISEEKLSPSASSQYQGMYAYNMSKLCNVLMSNHLNTILAFKGVTSNVVHPGNMINTSLSRNWWLYRLVFTIVRPFTKSLQQGAATTVYAAIAPELENVGGFYFNNCCAVEPSAAGQDAALASKLWELSTAMVERAVSSGAPHVAH